MTGLRASPGSSLGEVADIPLTAHFLGGAVISDRPEHGVVDPYQRVWGYPGVHVLDGAAVSANLGVNPALTITAQADRSDAPHDREPTDWTSRSHSEWHARWQVKRTPGSRARSWRGPGARQVAAHIRCR